MIFVCVGSREYQFNRLLKKIDLLVEQGAITDTVFAQIGQSSYLPKHYEYRRFIPEEEFNAYQNNADLIISHGGTGTLVGALKREKRVIAVPRLAKYGEHIDDHQIQIVQMLSDENYLRCVVDMDQLLPIILELKNDTTIKKYNKPSYVLQIIKDYLSSNNKIS